MTKKLISILLLIVLFGTMYGNGRKKHKDKTTYSLFSSLASPHSARSTAPRDSSSTASSSASSASSPSAGSESSASSSSSSAGSAGSAGSASSEASSLFGLRENEVYIRGQILDTNFIDPDTKEPKRPTTKRDSRFLHYTSNAINWQQNSQKNLELQALQHECEAERTAEALAPLSNYKIFEAIIRHRLPYVIEHVYGMKESKKTFNGTRYLCSEYPGIILIDELNFNHEEITARRWHGTFEISRFDDERMLGHHRHFKIDDLFMGETPDEFKPMPTEKAQTFVYHYDDEHEYIVVETPHYIFIKELHPPIEALKQVTYVLDRRIETTTKK
jgi:hypothetical protein